MVRNTYIYPPEPSMRIVSDIIAYTAAEMPKFNSISISGYHMQEAGRTWCRSSGFTLADGKEYVKAAIASGMDVDAFAGRLSFFFAIGMNFFMEAAKLRAARLLWHRIMTEFGAKRPESLMLRTHCQTSGVSLQEQDPYNNIVRTAYEALAAALGGTQSLHTNSFDEAMALPTEFSARIARNTQLILQHETGITHVVDPLAGSYYVESLTAELAEKAWALIEEVDGLGGMTRAVASGMPKLRIEESGGAAAGGGRPRRGGDRRGQPLPARARRIRSRSATSTTSRCARRRWRGWRASARRATRRPARRALAALEAAARVGGNLLAAAVEAARARATVGEISDAMERVFGRHRAEVKTLAGVYGAAYEGDAGFAAIQADVAAFAEAEGRRPRMLVVKMGQDGHDRGAKVIATAFADIGFDVDVGPLFQTPEEAAQDAHRQRRARRRHLEPGGGAQDAGAEAGRGAAGRRERARSSWSAAG